MRLGEWVDDESSRGDARKLAVIRFGVRQAQ